MVELTPAQRAFWQSDGAEDAAAVFNEIAGAIHHWAQGKGFWPPSEHGRNFGEQIALMHSELSEALEGHRTKAMDKHLPVYQSPAVELADTIIRILDTCAALGWPIGEILMAKMAFNCGRPYKHGKEY